jgi:hypothetical protein
MPTRDYRKVGESGQKEVQGVCHMGQIDIFDTTPATIENIHLAYFKECSRQTFCVHYRALAATLVCESKRNGGRRGLHEPCLHSFLLLFGTRDTNLINLLIHRLFDSDQDNEDSDASMGSKNKMTKTTVPSTKKPSASEDGGIAMAKLTDGLAKMTLKKKKEDQITFISLTVHHSYIIKHYT